MDVEARRWYKSHGSGKFRIEDFAEIGTGVVIEDGVLVFHPNRIHIGNNIYIGHNAILHGYHKNEIYVGDHSWVGQSCYLHGAGGIEIGRAVGIGPMAKIFTSVHDTKDISLPIIYSDMEFKKVVIGDGCDIGVGSIVLPGVEIGEGSLIGAGSVVTKDIPPYTVYAGNPARFLRKRSSLI